MAVINLSRIGCRVVAVATAAILTSGCFAQSQVEALNCDELKGAWAETEREMREVSADFSGDPQQKAEKLGVIADELKQKAEDLADPELSEAMKAVATDLGELATALGNPGGGMPPMPPTQGITRLSQAIQQKCPV